MVGYDFDKTIYDGDSSTNFLIFFLFRRPYMLLFLPWLACVALLYLLKILSKKKAKELYFFFIPWHKNVDKLVEKFWDKNWKKIYPWYKNQQKNDDVILSASLDFVFVPAMKRLGVTNFDCTHYDLKTGKIVGNNCYGEEKVERFKKMFGEKTLEAFYSDSMSDLPMMNISKKKFLVEKKIPHEIEKEN